MPANVVVTHTTARDPSRAVEETLDQLRLQAGGLPPRGALLYHPEGLPASELQEGFAARLPDVPLLGATSCLGTATAKGFSPGALAGLWLVGDGFGFGTALVAKQGVPARDGARLAQAALANAGIHSARTRFAVFHSTPGDEEGLLAGVFGQLDHQTALLGGSAADDELKGGWSVWTHQGVERSGAGLAVCDWPFPIAVNYQAGYLPTDRRGKVTAAQGRTLYLIDGRPAAQVYNEWTGGGIARALVEGGGVLAPTNLAPLGVSQGSLGGFDAYVLVHPAKVDAASHSLELMAEVAEGQTVALMRSTPEALTQRGAIAVRTALSRAKMRPQDLAGGLVIYCAGCMLAIRSRMKETVDEIRRALPNVPFATFFSFGEQGCVIPRQVAQGNLMVSALLLGKG